MKLGGYVYCAKISPEFECQVQRSKVKVTRDKKGRLALPTPPGAYEWYALAVSSVQQQTGPFLRL